MNGATIGKGAVRIRAKVSGLSLGKLSFILRQGLHCDTDRAPEIRVSGLPDVETLPA
jgi:hypothetical protein